MKRQPLGLPGLPGLPGLLQAIQGSRFIEPLVLLLIQLPLALHLILLVGPQNRTPPKSKSYVEDKGLPTVGK